MLNVLLTIALVSASPEVEIRAIDGRTVQGSLSEWTSQRITVESADGPMAFRREELLSVAPKAAAKKSDAASVFMELADGSTVSGSSYEVAKGKTRLTLPDGDRLEFPAKAVRFVRFSRPDEKLDAQWAEALKVQATSDLLVVRKREALDYLEGVIGNVDADKVIFELDKEPLEVKRPRVEGLIYAHPAGREPPAATCQVEVAAGWHLQAQSADFADGKLKIVTTGGVTIIRPWDNITRVDFSSSTIRYLSDLTPETLEWAPFFEFPQEITALAEHFKPRRDRGFADATLRLGGKTYPKGLSVMSKTTLVYRVPAGFRLFKVVAGIDDAVQESGNVRLEITADGTKLFDQTLTGSHEPQVLDLDVSGVKRLKIVVDYGEDSDVADYLNLCDARFTK